MKGNSWTKQKIHIIALCAETPLPPLYTSCSCMFSLPMYVKEDLSYNLKMLFILENGDITLSRKTEVLWRENLIAVQSYHIYSKHLYMKFMQKSTLGGQEG